eukprot:4847487-Pyramimonas_sp.AAC.2
MPNLAWEIFTKSEGTEMRAPIALSQIMSHSIGTATSIDTPRLTLHSSVGDPTPEALDAAD